MNILVHIVLGFLPTCGAGSLDWLPGYSRRSLLYYVQSCFTVQCFQFHCFLPDGSESQTQWMEKSLVLQFSTQPNRCSWSPWRLSKSWGRQSVGPPWSPCLCVWTCSECVSVVCFLLCLKMNKTRPALEHLPKITLLWLSGISEFTFPAVDIGLCSFSQPAPVWQCYGNVPGPLSVTACPRTSCCPFSCLWGKTCFFRLCFPQVWSHFSVNKLQEWGADLSIKAQTALGWVEPLPFSSSCWWKKRQIPVVLGQILFLMSGLCSVWSCWFCCWTDGLRLQSPQCLLVTLLFFLLPKLYVLLWRKKEYFTAQCTSLPGAESCSFCAFKLALALVQIPVKLAGMLSKRRMRNSKYQVQSTSLINNPLCRVSCRWRCPVRWWMWPVELITWWAWSGPLPRDAAGSQHCSRELQGPGDELLGKENLFMKPSDWAETAIAVSGCITQVLWPGCRKEARSPRSVEMQGVLWLLHDELPENLRPSSKLVNPSVPEDEEHLP